MKNETLKKLVKANILIAFLTLFLSCANREDSSIPNLDGNYVGTLSVKYSDRTVTIPTKITFANNQKKYSCSSNGKGDYQVNSSKKITFKDTNIWTADFDWNIILNGDYDYSYNGKSLTISAKKNNMGFYEYKLTKE